MSANPRALAARVISQVLDHGDDLDSAIKSAMPARLDPRDRALAQRLSYGALRWLPALKYFSGRLLQRPLADKERLVLHLLWVGLYQLWREPMPSHAVVHSTVAATKELKKEWAKGLINACLRRFGREQEHLVKGLTQEQARFALPDDWLRRIQHNWPEQWQEIVDASHQEPPLWLRVNRRRQKRDDYLQELATANIKAEASAAPDAVRLIQAMPVDRIPGFDLGRVSVQDAAAQLAVDALQLAPGQSVLDACAAPGGKTCHILEREPDLARMVAVDREEHRVTRIQQNLRRLSLNCELVRADATKPELWWDGEYFDRILLDAPCSASGVIRRHPDIPWRRKALSAQRTAILQDRLLRALWPLLKPGGMLVYATCSIFASENQDQIKQFMAATADARSVELPQWGMAQSVGRQMLPGQAGMDGFYYAALRRIDA